MSSTTIKWKFEDHALTDELGMPPTRVIYALAGGDREHEKNCGISP
jgi:hypothetical protein